MIERLGQELSEDLYIQEVLNAVDYCFSLVQGHHQHLEAAASEEEDLIQICGGGEGVSYAQRQQVVLLPSSLSVEGRRRSVSSNARSTTGQQIYVSEEGGGPQVVAADGVMSPLDYSNDDRYELSLS